MTVSTKILCGMTALALLAGCQNSKSFGPSDIQPSKFIKGLTGAESKPVRTAPAPAAAVPAPLETVVLPAENPVFSAPAPLVSPSPIVTESTQTFANDIYITESPAVAPIYQDTTAVAYIDEPAVTFVEEPTLAIEEPTIAAGSFEPAPLQTEVTYIAADPVLEPIPKPSVPAPVALEPIETATLSVEPAFIQEPSQALEIEVAVPTNLDEIAPPPVVEADFVPPSVIEESELAPLDAPILPSTEILESELAPPVSEAAAPQRPAFTPIPQPGLTDYGSAF